MVQRHSSPGSVCLFAVGELFRAFHHYRQHYSHPNLTRLSNKTWHFMSINKDAKQNTLQKKCIPLLGYKIYLCSNDTPRCWGTGMIASSSTFRPHSGRVIRDMFRLLDAVTALYGSTSLQQSSKGSCSLLVSGYNLRADCQWRTLVPPLNSGANAAPASVLALM